MGLALAAHLLTNVIPDWSTTSAISVSPWHVLWRESLISLAVVLPCTLAWGMSFPLSVASLDSSGKGVGRNVAHLYAVNTAGSIAGAIGTAFLFARSIETQRIIQLAIVLAAIAGMAVLISAKAHDIKTTARRVRYAECIGVVIGVLLLVRDISPLPGVLIAFGRRSAEWIATSRIADTGRIIYAGEGLDDFVAVSKTADG